MGTKEFCCICGLQERALYNIRCEECDAPDLDDNSDEEDIRQEVLSSDYEWNLEKSVNQDV